MNTYKDLQIWKDSVNLIKDVYAIINIIPKSEEYNLKLQLKRAVTSISLNIAEGKSRRTVKDFANYLNIAFGSLMETRAIIDICIELNYISRNNELDKNIELLGKKINKLRCVLK